MKVWFFLYTLPLLVGCLLINNFFIFEAASQLVFSAASEKDLTESDFWKITEDNIDKMQVGCTGEYTRYHPEVIDIEKVNRKADEAAKQAVQSESEETEEFIENCRNKRRESGSYREYLFSCEELGDKARGGKYKDAFDSARNKFLGEALGKRNKAILEREREYLRDLLLPKREQARHKSQEAVSTYENMQNSDSSGERAQEIEIEKNRAIDYLKEEYEIAYQVLRYYNRLESLTILKDEYRDYYYDIRRKILASRNDRESVRQSLGNLGYHLEPVTGE